MRRVKAGSRAGARSRSPVPSNDRYLNSTNATHDGDLMETLRGNLAGPRHQGIQGPTGTGPDWLAGARRCG